MQVINPTTGKFLREYDEYTEPDVAAKLANADQAFQAWRHTSFDDRAAVLWKVAAILRKGAAGYAHLMTEEMGKPIRQAESEVEKCARGCEYFAKNAAKFLAPQDISVDGAQVQVRFDPLGAVLAIMPWNFPFWQVFRFAAPAIMAGNVGIVKHAANVPGSALAIEAILQEAGLPEGVFTVLLLSRDRASALIEHPSIQAVTLTGSERAGMAVAAAAGKAIKKTVLELGGSDPFIVLADADLRLAAEQAVTARTINSGQSCIAAKRFLVEESVYDEFAERMQGRMSSLRLGDPLDPKNDVGPLARADLRDALHHQVERSIAMGARLKLGGKPVAGDGFFYPPTLLSHVTPEMPAFAEETFGPVAALTRVRDSDEAVQLANTSRFGLGASIWTRDTQRAELLATDIQSGCVFVNEIVQSDPRAPFGGVKRSGYGRELSAFGIREFTNIKTVWVHQLDVVEEASQESFPASDAPSWTPVSKS